MDEIKPHKGKFTVTLDGEEMKAFGISSFDPSELRDVPVAEIGGKVRSVMKGRMEMAAIELKHNPDAGRGHSEQQAFYDWMRAVSVPVEPWTFPIHDETQGDDWLVVYTESHFTGMSRAPGGGISVGASMSGQEVWLRCPHGMISDDETKAIWLEEKASEEVSLAIEPFPRVVTFDD
jgi:hypothetical protein